MPLELKPAEEKRRIICICFHSRPCIYKYYNQQKKETFADIRTRQKPGAGFPAFRHTLFTLLYYHIRILFVKNKILTNSTLYTEIKTKNLIYILEKNNYSNKLEHRRPRILTVQFLIRKFTHRCTKTSEKKKQQKSTILFSSRPFQFLPRIVLFYDLLVRGPLFAAEIATEFNYQRGGSYTKIQTMVRKTLQQCIKRTIDSDCRGRGAKGFITLWPRRFQVCFGKGLGALFFIAEMQSACDQQVWFIVKIFILFDFFVFRVNFILIGMANIKLYFMIFQQNNIFFSFENRRFKMGSERFAIQRSFLSDCCVYRPFNGDL